MIFTLEKQKTKEKNTERLTETITEERTYYRASLLDILTDEKNNDLIELCDNKGKTVRFKQIATVPIGEKLYCILKPLTNTENYRVGESIVFRLEDMGQGTYALISEKDEKNSIKVFLIYYKMLFDSVKNSSLDNETKSKKLSVIKSLALEYRALLKSDK